MTTATASRATPKQLRMLHAIGRRRGLLHDDLRAVCGVGSLADLTSSAAATAIDRLQTDRPDRRRRRGRQPLYAGEVRLASDATSAQRELIIELLGRLGWYHGPDSLKRGIRGRHCIADLGSSHIDRAAASDLINELWSAIRKGEEGSRMED